MDSNAWGKIFRLFAAAAAGIGLIGAGVVLRNKDAGTVEGLTTAASVWVAAAIGIACALAA